MPHQQQSARQLRRHVITYQDKWKFVHWLACRISRQHITPLKRS